MSEGETETETFDGEFFKKFHEVVSVNHSIHAEFSDEEGKMVSTFCLIIHCLQSQSGYGSRFSIIN